MHYVDWSGGQPGHLLYDPFEEEALLFAHGSHHICPEMKKALQGVFLIAEQKKRIEESTKVSSQSDQPSPKFPRDVKSGFYLSESHSGSTMLQKLSKCEVNA